MQPYLDLLKLNLNKHTENDLLEDLLDEEIIMFGDDHNMNSGRLWLRDLLFKVADHFKVLSLEYLENNKQFQPALLVDYLDKVYEKDFPGFDVHSITRLIKEAKSLGMQVNGIEMPHESYENWYDSHAQEERTKYLSNNILGDLKQGNVLVLMGADHVEKRDTNVYGQLKLALDEKDILSVVFVGGKSWSIDTEEYWIRNIELAAQKLDRDEEFFVLKNDFREYPCDWVVHFPQIEKIDSTI